MFILFIFFYLFLFFLPFLNKFYLKNIVYKTAFDILVDIKNEQKNLFLDKEKLRIKVNLFFSFYIQDCLNEPSLYYYYYTKNFILFMCISNKFLYFIDCYYRIYLTKCLISKNHNFMNLIKYGCLSLNNKNINFITFFSFYLNNYNYFDIIYIYEKNYRISFFLYGFFFSIFIEYKKKLLNYELYKMLFGDELVQEYFKEELEEYENLYFIYSL
jgi:hypothetical protein